MDWVKQVVVKYRWHAGSMSRNARLGRAGLLRALDKCFADDTLPPDIVQHKNRVYARAHLRAASRSYAEGLLELAEADVAQAIQLDPSLLAPASTELSMLFHAWSEHYRPILTDHLSYLWIVQAHLPKSAKRLRKQLRHAIAEEYLNRAIGSYRHCDLRAVRRLIPRILALDPTFFCNHGVLSLGFESLAGRKPAQIMRSLCHSRPLGARHAHG
jgi:hypothetical protein